MLRLLLITAPLFKVYLERWTSFSPQNSLLYCDPTQTWHQPRTLRSPSWVIDATAIRCIGCLLGLGVSNAMWQLKFPSKGLSHLTGLWNAVGSEMHTNTAGKNSCNKDIYKPTGGLCFFKFKQTKAKNKTIRLTKCSPPYVIRNTIKRNSFFKIISYIRQNEL